MELPNDPQQLREVLQEVIRLWDDEGPQGRSLRNLLADEAAVRLLRVKGVTTVVPNSKYL